MDRPRPTLERAISLLQNSQDSLYAHLSVNEVITALQTIQTKFEQTGIPDKVQLNLLFAPTGSIQEISITMAGVMSSSNWLPKWINSRKVTGKHELCECS